MSDYDKKLFPCGPPPVRRSKMPQDESGISKFISATANSGNSLAAKNSKGDHTSTAPPTVKTPPAVTQARPGPQESEPTKERAGRKPLEKHGVSIKDLIYDGMKQASADTGIPYRVFSNCKKKGAPGFRYNRIYMSEFLPWLFEQEGSDVGLDGKTRYENARAELAEINVQEKRGRVIARDDVTGAAAKVQSVLFAAIERLSAELPPLLKGLSETEIQARLRERETIIRANVKKELAGMISPPGPPAGENSKQSKT